MAPERRQGSELHWLEARCEMLERAEAKSCDPDRIRLGRCDETISAILRENVRWAEVATSSSHGFQEQRCCIRPGQIRANELQGIAAGVRSQQTGKRRMSCAFTHWSRVTARRVGRLEFSFRRGGTHLVRITDREDRVAPQAGRRFLPQTTTQPKTTPM